MAADILNLVRRAIRLFRKQAEYQSRIPMTCYLAACIVLAKEREEGRLDDQLFHQLVVKLIQAGVEVERPSMEVPLELPFVGQLAAQMLASLMLRNSTNFAIESRRR